MNRATLASAGILALALATSASAAVIGTSTPQTINAGSSVTISLDTDTAYTFSLTDPSAPQSLSAVSVATSGDAQVYGNGAFFGGRPASLQSGTLVPEQLSLGDFMFYDAPSAIDFSVAVTDIALRFLLSDGVHFGYARVGGNQLLAFGYETMVGVSIATGAEITGPFPVDEVPEPAAFALLGMGVLGIAALRRRRAA